MKRLIVDTGIWYALLDKADSKAIYADTIKEIFDKHQLIVPFPSLYETINTKLIKNRYNQAVGLFYYLNNSQKVILIPDDNYRDKALKTVNSNLNNKDKQYSLVDTIIRLMMEDASLGDIAVITFNVGDFIGVNNIDVVSPETIYNLKSEKKTTKKKKM